MMSYQTRTRISLIVLLTFAGLLAFAVTTRAQTCTLRTQGYTGGCTNVNVLWFTQTPQSQIARFELNTFAGRFTSDNTRRSFSIPTGCGSGGQVVITEVRSDGSTCTAQYSGNLPHNRPCDQCNGIGARMATVNAASFSGSLAADALAAAFGDADFTTQTEYAYDADPFTPGYQLPTTLGGVRAFVTTGVQNQVALFFVSPRQVNFQVPVDLPEGLHSMTVATPDGRTIFGDVLINRNSPGIFTLGQNGSGEASCYWIVARQGIFQNIYPGGQLQNVQPGDRVFLILFGTGVNDSRARLRLVGPTGQTAEYESLYAGDAPVFVALDQINFEIPLADLWRGTAGGQVTVFDPAGAFWRSNGFTVFGLR